jgi:hypothetical protein
MDTNPTSVPSSYLPPPFAHVNSITRDEHSEVEVLPAPKDGIGNHWVRMLRAWGSVGIIGLLVVWAIFNTKR